MRTKEKTSSENVSNTILGKALRAAALTVIIFSFAVTGSFDSIFAQSASTPVIAGYRDFNYSGGGPTSEPTEEKPESKVWFHDGFWWGVLWDASLETFRIHRLDPATQNWTSTGPDVDARDRSSADALSDGNTLYISSRAKDNHKDSDGPATAIFLRYSYNAGSQSYTVDSGFPVDIPGTARTRALTIAKDSNDKLWATWTLNSRVMVNRSLADDLTWGTAFELPGQGNLLDANDLSAAVNLGGDIGIGWSQQDDQQLYFMVHESDSADTTWSLRESVFPSGSGNIADDHINFACSPNGTVVLTNKTALGGAGVPVVYLNLRDPATGLWENHVVWVKEDDPTRPIAIINSDTDSVYVFAKIDAILPKSIYMKSAHLSNPVFGSGLGRVAIKSLQEDDTNNPTSTKSCVTNASGLLVLASSKSSKNYLHSSLDFNNILPQALPDEGNTNETTPVLLDVTANDSDSDGSLDLSSVVVVADPANGVTSVSTVTGAVTYTPNPGFSGVDTFYYTVADNDGANAVAAAVTITVNDSPVANNDTTTTEEETFVNIDVLANDTDSDGSIDTTTVTIATQPANGVVSVAATNGVITYTPNTNFAGVDVFGYTVQDDSAAVSNEATVVVTVSGENDPPLAVNDTTDADNRATFGIAVTANDSDPESSIDVSTLLITQAPTNGTATTDTSTGVISYSAAAGYFGPDSLKYTVNDATGLISNVATVLITVKAVPLAVNDSTATDVNAAVVVDVIANDSDPDGAIVPASVTVVNAPSSGSASASAGNGTITYTPGTNFTGGATFTYQVADDDGLLSDTTTVFVKVNEAPVANDDDAFTTKSVPVEIDILANDSDGDGTLNAASVVSTFGPLNGSLVLNPATGAVTYTPNALFSGTDIFTYTVEDDNGSLSNEGFVSIRVNGPPTANNDQPQTDEDTPVAIEVTANDTDSDGTIVDSTVALASQPSNGLATVDSVTGFITYTPNENYFGPDSFTYTVNDNDGTVSNSAQVNVTVNAVNDPPLAVNDTTVTAEETPLNISVLANDLDIDSSVDPLTVIVTSGPANGQAAVNPTTGEITYTPSTDFVGIDSLDYTVDDDLGAQSNTARVFVTVSNENDAPVAVVDTVLLQEDTPVSIRVTDNDSDIDGTVDTTAVTLLTQPQSGSADLDLSRGIVTYSPGLNFVGIDSFAYSVKDDFGAESNAATVFLVIVNVNDVPVAVGDTASTSEEVAVEVAVTANDFDVDGIVQPGTVALVLQPANGIASAGPGPGVITYTPALDFVGLDSLQYAVQDDSAGTSLPGTLLITVTDINDPPVAVDDTVTTPEEVAINITLTSNDFDIDGQVDVTSVALVSQPVNGSAALNALTGVVTYTPAVDFAGQDSLSYTVLDDDGVISPVANVRITVTNENDAPVAINDTIAVTEEVAVQVDASANDLDVDGFVVASTVLLSSQPLHGTAVVDGSNGVITYTPEKDFFGTDSLGYTVQDDGGALSNTGIVLLNVSNVNDPPLAVNDTSFTTLNTPVSIMITANDVDTDGVVNPASILAGSSSNGTTSIKATGEVTYTPDPGFGGIDSFIYTVRDDSGAASNEATVFISVNAAPLAANDTSVTTEDIPVEIGVADNDLDLDGTLNLSSVFLVTQPANGSAVVDPVTGVITYSPNTNFTGEDSFTYTIEDNDGFVSNTASVLVVVNRKPFALNDTGTTDEDTPAVFDVISNDIDIDGFIDPTTVSIVTAPQNGTAAADSVSGAVTYVPNANFFGGDTFTYQVNDNNGAATNVASVSVTVNAVNDPPIVANDFVNVETNLPEALDVLLNDQDIDGTIDPTTVLIALQPANGGATVNPGGTITYSPDFGFIGADSLRYTVKDDQGETSAEATVTIAVSSDNAPPVAVNDTVAVAEEAEIIIAVLSNDSDSDGTLAPAFVQVLTAPGHGVAAVNTGAGTISYTSAIDFFGVDSLTYNVRDNDGALSNSATVIINVIDQNEAPVAVDDTANVSEDVPAVIAVAANDSDVDGSLNLASVSLTVAPQNGTATTNNLTGEITYTPATDFTGLDSLRYSINDDLGAASNEATVRITVGPVNDAPTALPDTAITSINKAVTISVVANDFDVDGTINGATVSVTAAQNGSTALLPNGDIVYTPLSGFVGLDSLTYTVRDNSGAVSNVASVFITVTNENDLPVAVNDTSFTDEDIAVVIEVVSNDSDPDGSLDSSTVTVELAPTQGSASVNPTTGAVTYTPNEHFFGADSLQYTIKDDVGASSNMATVFITVNAVVDLPVAANDTVSTAEDTVLEIGVADNDNDPDGTLDLTSVVVVDGPGNGTFLVNSGTGVISYAPQLNFHGADTLLYTIDDTEGNTSNQATVFITVTETNDAPIAANDTVTTNEDVGLTFSVIDNDSDQDGTLNAGSVSIVVGPANGQATVDGTTGAVTYTPDENFNGTDSLQYTVEDNLALASTPATVLINVVDVNDSPVATNDTTSTAEDTAIQIAVTLNDSDVDGTFTVSEAANGQNGTVTIGPGPGILTYTPALDFKGGDFFAYVITDEDAASDTALVFVDVTGENDPPVATNDTVSVDEDQSLTFNPLVNDSDPDGSLDATTVTFQVDPKNGLANADPVSGAITYTPEPNFSGPDTLVYVVQDDLGLSSNQGTVFIAINPVNDAPLAVNDTTVTTEEVALDIDVSANDSDLDGTLDLSTVAILAGPENGTASVSPADGTIIYTPDTDFDGLDSLDYQIRDDGGLLSNVARVFINVTGQNDPPVALDDNAETDEETPVTITVLSNDTDADGSLDVTTVSSGQGPGHGTVVVSQAGTVTYTPEKDFFGTDTLTYTVQDNLGASSNSALVEIVVRDVNDPPVAVNDAGAVFGGVPVAVDVTQNDTDSDGTINPASVSISTFPANGTVAINGITGVVTYTPNSGFQGQDNFSYRVSDDDGAQSNAATVVVVVSQPSVLAFEPTDDAQVKLTAPASNYGDKGTGKVESGKFQSYFKFNVTGISTTVESAVLRLRVADGETDGSVSGGSIHLTSNQFSGTSQSWTEAGLNAGNAPTVQQGPLSTRGAVAMNEVVEFDVSSVVSGNGVFSFCIISSSGDQVKYFTKEGTAPEKPQLVIQASQGGGTGNNAPFAFDDTTSTPAETAVSINVASNDVDSDGTLDLTSVSVVSPPGNGSAAVNPVSGVITYTPNAAFSGPEQFGYTIRDNDGAESNSATVVVNVIGPNNPPVAVNDSATTSESTTIAISVLANDSDVDGSLVPASVTIVSNPSSGQTAGGAQPGTISYTPSAGFLGTDSFTYTVADDDGDASNEATVFVEVTAQNLPPVAINDTTNTNEGISVIVDVTANDSDPDGALDVTTVTLIATPGKGTAAANANSGLVTYTPNAGFSGVDEFTYTVADDQGAVSDTATVTIIVSGVNLAPVAANDTAATTEGQALILAIIANDSDPDGSVDPASVNISNAPANGSASVDAQTGAVTYSPDSGFTGNDEFSYTVRDNEGAESNTAVVFINVTAGGGTQILTLQPTDDAQVKLTDATNNYATKSTAKVEAGKFSTYLKFNVSGISGTVQTAVLRLRVGDAGSDASESGGNVFLTSVNLKGSATPWTETVLTSGNAPDATGNPLSSQGPVSPLQIVEFDVSSAISGNGAISFCITSLSGDQVKYYTKEGLTPPELVITTSGGSTNSSPLANDDNASTDINTSVQIDVTLNDSDADGTLDLTTVALGTPPVFGSTQISASTGVVTYTPNVGFNGADSFTYTVRDNEGATSNSATVTVTVTGGNIPPVAVDDNGSTNEGISVPIDVTVNDSDPDGRLVVTSVAIQTSPANGAAALNQATGVVTYTPNGGFTGSDSFTYTVQDDEGAVSNVATVTVTVNGSGGGGSGQTLTFLPTDDAQVKLTAPENNYGTKSTSKAQVGTFTSFYKFSITGLSGPATSARLQLSVTDQSSSAGSIFSVSNALQGSATPWTEGILTAGNAPQILGNPLSTGGSAAVGDIADFDVSAAIAGNGVFSFAISKSVGDKVAFFTKEGDIAPRLIVTTGSGGGNSAPVAANDNAVTDEGLPVSIDVTANDSDADGTIVISSVFVTTLPSNGSTSVNGTTGVITYTPNSSFSGNDSFSYTVNDNSGAVSNAALVSVTVNASGNTAPTATNDAATVNAGASVIIAVAGNDFDPDGALDLTSVEVTVAPANGTAAVNGATGDVSYTPDPGFSGTDTFGYTIKDNGGVTSNTATVTVTVSGGQTQTLTFESTDDGQVKHSAPGTNYGTKETGKVEEGKFSVYFKFNVTGLSGAVTNAKIRLQVTSDLADGSDQGGSMFAASNNHSSNNTAWTESALTFGNAPDITSGVLSSLNAVLPNDVVEFNVTSAVTGNGIFSFCLQGDSPDQAKYFMREGAVTPLLVVETGAAVAAAQSIRTEAEASDLTESLDASGVLPTTLSLGRNYPNPFNPATTIRYDLPEASNVKLMVFNIMGQLVKTLVEGEETPGFKSVRWEGQNDSGVAVSSGIYFLRLEVGQQKFSRRILLQK